MKASIAVSLGDQVLHTVNYTSKSNRGDPAFTFQTLFGMLCVEFPAVYEERTFDKFVFTVEATNEVANG